MKTLTVFTPTFNRADKLPQVFESLMRQTSKDFEWLIIDDGSTDNSEAVVSQFKEKSDFEIRYYWKENGGRHTAVNYSYQFLRTPYVITCDSDDELVNNAVELVIKIWASIPENEYDRYWCVTGREINSIDMKMVGTPFPENINLLRGTKKRKAILRHPGEKHCCRKVDIHKEYLFPVYKDTRFVTENIVWEKINKKYEQYCVNVVFGIYHMESSDSLSKGKKEYTYERFRSGYYASLFYVDEMFHEILINKRVILAFVNLSRCAILTNEPIKVTLSKIKEWYKKIMILGGYPISLVWIKMHKEKVEKIKKVQVVDEYEKS